MLYSCRVVTQFLFLLKHLILRSKSFKWMKVSVKIYFDLIFCTDIYLTRKCFNCGTKGSDSFKTIPYKNILKTIKSWSPFTFTIDSKSKLGQYGFIQCKRPVFSVATKKCGRLIISPQLLTVVQRKEENPLRCYKNFNINKS